MRHSRRRACGSCQTCGRTERAHRSLQNRRRFRTAPTRLIVVSLSEERRRPEPVRIIGHRPTDSAEEADYHVVEARYRGGHVVWLRFRDGTSGEIDLTSALEGPIFEPLRDPEVFRRFEVHPEFHTLVWANGADMAPEFLRDNIRVTA